MEKWSLKYSSYINVSKFLISIYYDIIICSEIELYIYK